jgi:hypothetical protein
MRIQPNVIVQFGSALYEEEVTRETTLPVQRTLSHLDNHTNSQGISYQLLCLRVRFSLMCSISCAFVCFSLLFLFSRGIQPECAECHSSMHSPSYNACPKQRFRSAFFVLCVNVYGINLAHLLLSL